MEPATLRPEHDRYARVESLRLGGVPVQPEWIAYGGTGAAPLEILAGFGLLELEYAAFRRGAAVLDESRRATLEVRGADRVDFLNRMVTQELKGLAPGEVRAGFLLNRKGRIEADLLFVEPPAAPGEAAATLIDVDVHDAGRAAELLRAMVFSEDVSIEDASATWARIAVHGPEAPDVLARAGADGESLRALGSDMRCARSAVDGVPAVLARHDQAGVPGIHVLVPRAGAAQAWDAIVSQVEARDGGRRRARPAGWHAFNIARIEAGTPLFHVDFGPESLPHETGLLDARVSFRKGCYPGQEVVARMQSLGKPKQRVVALRIGEDALPVAGSPVFELAPDGAPGNPVGTVTSSTLAPMLGAVPVAFAMVRTASAAPGTVLAVPAEGARATATVQESLRFLPPGDRPA